MTEERIKELQDFTLEFQDQLREARDIYLKKQSESKTIEHKYLKTENPKTKLHLPKNIEKNKKNLYKNKNAEKLKLSDHWIPNCFFGKSLEKFKRLENQHFLTSWELVINNNI